MRSTSQSRQHGVIRAIITLRPSEAYYLLNRSISQIPQCTCPISHNTPFRTEMGRFLMVYCGTRHRCIVRFAWYYHQWFQHGLVPCLAPGHYLNSCGYTCIVNWTLRTNIYIRIFHKEMCKFDVICKMDAIMFWLQCFIKPIWFSIRKYTYIGKNLDKNLMKIFFS